MTIAVYNYRALRSIQTPPWLTIPGISGIYGIFIIDNNFNSTSSLIVTYTPRLQAMRRAAKKAERPCAVNSSYRDRCGQHQIQQLCVRNGRKGEQYRAARRSLLLLETRTRSGTSFTDIADRERTEHHLRSSFIQMSSDLNKTLLCLL